MRYLSLNLETNYRVLALCVLDQSNINENFSLEHKNEFLTGTQLILTVVCYTMPHELPPIASSYLLQEIGPQLVSNSVFMPTYSSWYY